MKPGQIVICRQPGLFFGLPVEIVYQDPENPYIDKEHPGSFIVKDSSGKPRNIPAELLEKPAFEELEVNTILAKTTLVDTKT